jgi:hypothetical protein
MNDNPISNPFDEDEKKSSKFAFDNSTMGLPDAGDSNRWMLVWLSLGILAMCCGLIAGAGIIYYKPNAQQLIGQYFPSPTLTPSSTPKPTATATLTPSPTSTPTLNLTATQQILDVTSTVEVVQSTATEVASNWKVAFSEPFDSNKNKWPTGPSDDSYANITHTLENGTYTWDVTAHQDFIGWNRINKKTYADFSFSAQVQQTIESGNSDMGLILREDSDGNFYYFGITNDQQYLLALYKDKQWSNLIDWTSSSALSTDQPNQLTVIAQGNHFLLFINNQFVNEAYDDQVQQGANAIAVELSPADARVVYQFDSIEVRTK